MVNEEEDVRLARVLREIANCVMEGIVIEADFPSKNGNERLAILDMEVWGCKGERNHSPPALRESYVQ